MIILNESQFLAQAELYLDRVIADFDPMTVTLNDGKSIVILPE